MIDLWLIMHKMVAFEYLGHFVFSSGKREEVETRCHLQS